MATSVIKNEAYQIMSLRNDVDVLSGAMIKSVEKTLSSDSAGNVTLFPGETKPVVCVEVKNDTTMVVPFYGYGSTYGKCIVGGGNVPQYAVNQSDITMKIYYLDQ